MQILGLDIRYAQGASSSRVKGAVPSAVLAMEEYLGMVRKSNIVLVQYRNRIHRHVHHIDNFNAGHRTRRGSAFLVHSNFSTMLRQKG